MFKIKFKKRFYIMILSYNRRSSRPTLVAFAPSQDKQNKVINKIKHFIRILLLKFKLS